MFMMFTVSVQYESVHYFLQVNQPVKLDVLYVLLYSAEIQAERIQQNIEFIFDSLAMQIYYTA